MKSHIPVCVPSVLERLKKKRAFTLIEILVVIAIIAILAALLFPVIGKMGAKTRQTESAARLRNIGTAFAQYAADHDSRIPVAYSTSRNSEGLTYGTWANQLFRGEYLTADTESWLYGDTVGCPQQLADHPEAPTNFTYGMNRRIGDHPNPPAPHGARRTVQVTQLTRTALVMNGVWNGSQFSSSTNETYASLVEPVFGGDSVMIAFLDGHVAPIKIADIPDDLASDEGKTFWMGD